MPRNSSGKWVARAAATGGGRTYRGQMPVNWYASLVLIVILGLGSVVYARYEYQRGTAPNTVAPVKGGAPWFAGIAFDICGTQQPSLAANVVNTSTQSFYTAGQGVIIISPKKTSDAGTNAVLGKFVSSYQGLTLTATEIRLPAPPTTTSKKTSKTKPTATTYHNGDKCPHGTKDAGKAGQVMVTYWPNAFASKSTPVVHHGDPGTLRFTDDQLITVGFVPAGTKLPKPNGTVVTALLNLSTGASTSTVPTTTTTTPTSPTTTTTPTSSTTTTTPTSSTTTTTTSASSTTTTSGK